MELIAAVFTATLSLRKSFKTVLQLHNKYTFAFGVLLTLEGIDQLVFRMWLGSMADVRSNRVGQSLWSRYGRIKRKTDSDMQELGILYERRKTNQVMRKTNKGSKGVENCYPSDVDDNPETTNSSFAHVNKEKAHSYDLHQIGRSTPESLTDLTEGESFDDELRQIHMADSDSNDQFTSNSNNNYDDNDSVMVIFRLLVFSKTLDRETRCYTLLSHFSVSLHPFDAWPTPNLQTSNTLHSIFCPGVILNPRNWNPRIH